ncbi:MAG: alpha/beta fold hydrolase [Chloroflexota bacterium]|nr:alpha/beta fold hydrolase [Chloroflexota bacterium]
MRLGQIQAPTLVIFGDDDKIVPVEGSRRLAADIPGAELAILADCGHLPQEECPSAFKSVVEDFITQLEENK